MIQPVFEDFNVELRGAPWILCDSVMSYRGPNKVREIIICGAGGCVSGDTELWNPVEGRGYRIDELCASRTQPTVLALNGPVLADVPFVKGYEPLYRVTLESGRTCLVTAAHRFLAFDQLGSSHWVRLDALSPGMELLSSSLVDAHRLIGTDQDSRERCYPWYRQSGGQPLCDQENVRVSVPSQLGVLERTRGGSRSGVLACEQERTRACLASVHPSTKGSYHASGQPDSVEGQLLGSPLERAFGWYLGASKASSGTFPWNEEEAARPVSECIRRISCSWDKVYRSHRDRIKSIVYEKTDFYFDLHVPGEGHYLADGMWSHNTGKSRGILQVIAFLCEEYPNLRVLLSRSTRESMTSSTLVEWEDCFPAGHPVIQGPQREGRSIYHFPNGSEVAIIGLDKPGKLFSTKWDIIYVEELTGSGSDIGVELETWELFYRGLRGEHPVNGQHLLIGSCNPSYPTHWVKQRIDDKMCEFIPSYHQDNPAYYDLKTKSWTQRGMSYLKGLEHMSGHRKRRLLHGEWCAAEGLVWDEWDDAKHIVECDVFSSFSKTTVTPPWSGNPIEMHWTFGSFDWGYSDPAVFQVWGVDNDRRMWRLAEIFRTRETLDWWADRVAELYKEFGLSLVVADPSRNDAQAAFNRRIATERGHDVPGFCIGAENKRDGDFGGMAAVRSMMTMRSDGHPGMLFVKDALRFGVDPELKRLGKPWCTEMEIPGYQFKVEKDGRANRDKTDPRCSDHGCFIAGTLVETDSGARPIESLSAGDRVLTPIGYMPVLEGGMTNADAEVYELWTTGGRIIGTGDHPIWSNGEWVRLDSLRYDDSIAACLKRSFTTASCSGGTPRRRTGKTACTIAGATGIEPCTCTECSMSRYMDRSLTGWKSITSTETRSTMIRRTSKRFTDTTTESGTENGFPTSASGWPWSTLPGCDILQPNGTDLRTVGLGTASTLERLPTQRFPSQRRASGAVALTSQSRPLDSAQTLASQRSEGALALMTSSESAPCAVDCSGLTATQRPGLVAGRVLGLRVVGRSPVYNITVPWAGCYFANGVLVSNCDAARYASAYVYVRDLRDAPRRNKYPLGTIGHSATWPGGRSFEEWWDGQTIDVAL